MHLLVTVVINVVELRLDEHLGEGLDVGEGDLGGGQAVLQGYLGQ